MLQRAYANVRRSLIGVALVLSYCGIVLVMADNLVPASDSFAVLAGGALVFISPVTYSVLLIASGASLVLAGA